jgi:hypothetical protein
VNRRWIAGLAALLVLAPVLWTAWWLLAAQTRDRGLAAWLDARRAEGWQAEAAAIATTGFPRRLDTRVERLALADPEVGWAWETPSLDIRGDAWAPTRVEVALPPEQTLAAPGEAMTLRSETLGGTLGFLPGPSLELAALAIEGAGLALDAGSGWTAGADRLEAAVREADPATAPAHAYDLTLAAETVRLPPALDALIDPGGVLDAVFDRLTLDARAAFDAPLDRRAVEDGPPPLSAVSLRDLDARWGDLALRARGNLRADAEGYAEGRLDLRAENWRRMLRAARDAGALDRGLADAIEAGLGLLAMLGGSEETIEAPLSFEGGWTRLGPVPVGPAPRLR